MEDVHLSNNSLITCQEKNPFKEDFPGKGWNKSFLKRHPDITTRMSEGVTQASTNISENDIRFWFKKIHQYLTEEELDNILSDPNRIYNGNETGFLLSPHTKKGTCS